jgi:hypothetical protein
MGKWENGIQESLKPKAQGVKLKAQGSKPKA